MSEKKSQDDTSLQSLDDLTLNEVEDIIRDTSPERLETISQEIHQVSYSGPLPHPGLLKEFDEVIPNGADRIMKMAENQLNHRIDVEKSIVNAKNRDSRNGVFFAGTIGIIGIIGSIILLALDKTVSGILIGGGTLGSLVGIYLRGTHLDKEVLNENHNNKDD